MSESSDEEELEYHVTFATPGSRKSTTVKHYDQAEHSALIQGVQEEGAGGEDCYQSVRDDEDSDDDDDSDLTDADDGSAVEEALEPVIVLIGWAGCKEKHLAKYSEFYERNGCTTIRYIPNVHKLFFNSESLRRDAGKLLELLFDLDVAESPIVLHVFSNGGLTIYKYMVDLLCCGGGGQQPRRNGGPVAGDGNDLDGLNVVGAIFDSVPTSYFTGYCQALWIITDSKTFLMRVALVIAFALFYACSRLGVLRVLGLRRDRFLDFYKESKLDPSRWSQLFLYSKADVLIPYRGVAELVEFRRKKGVNVHEICWDDSPHVMHYKYHTDEYESNCLNFVGNCVKDF